MEIAALYTPRTRIVLGRLFCIALLGALLVSGSAWRQTAPLFAHSLSLMALALIAVGMMGRLWSASYIAGHKNTGLITGGPYSMCRNPLYLSSFIGGLGVTLATETLTLPLVFTIAFWSYYLGVAIQEEIQLQQRHGPAFRDYRRRVPRFRPNPALFWEPRWHAISPAHVRRAFAEVPWFLLAAAVIEFCQELHVTGYLPTLITLY